MKAFWVASASANIMYHDVPGTGSPLIFIHGLGCASSCDYPRVISDASLRGRRAMLVDLLGSGFSERPFRFGYSIDDHAHSIDELVRNACEEPVSIFGHSMGGAVAITLATLLGSKADKIVLTEPNLEPGGGIFSTKIAEMSEEDYVARGHATTIEDARSAGNTIWAASLAISAPHAVHRGAASLVAGSEPTWLAMLHALPMPKTVIFGEHSLPSADFARLQRDGCNVDTVPNAGHSMASDNPSGLAEAICKAVR